MSNQAYLTIGPTELPEKEAMWHRHDKYEEILFKDKEGKIDTKLEKRFKEQPHL